MLKSAERQHSNDSLSENKLNAKKKWSIMKEVLGKNTVHCLPSSFHINGSLIDNKKTIANSFNKYFNNVGKNLAKDIPPVNISPTSYINSHYRIRYIYMKCLKMK